jgi:penicillin-binding protein 1A
VTGAAIVLAVAAVGLLIGTIWFVQSAARGLPNQAGLDRIGDMALSTTVFDAGDKFAFTIYEEQRIEIPLTEVSPHLIQALIAIEDQRFYEHSGFDYVRIVAAALANLRHGRVTQGGSTITQQLARQSFLKPDKTIRRKLQELILARRIERQFSKGRILELYLNKVYFGDGLYGVEAASRGYFGKHASELSLAEAALLAGLVKSPSTYAPTINMPRALARRNLVLQAMLDIHVIDRPTWEAARVAPVTLHDNLRADDPHGRYFKEHLRRELVARFGTERVYEGGLRVFSTIDMSMQVAAESVVDQSLKALDKRRAPYEARRRARTRNADAASGETDSPLQAALIAIDPRTGHVRAMVGGRDFGQSYFNRAVQAKRQPGSAFKPFVYAAALEEGYTPATIIDHLDDPVDTLQGAWMPEDEHSSASSMSLRTALRTSSNRAAVQLLQRIGVPRAVQYARVMGVGNVPSVPSLALGSGEVTLQSLTAAYAAFANHGVVPRPILIRRVEDQDGQVLYEAPKNTPVRAISEATAFLMTTMLADVIDAGTAARARSLGFALPAAGKTGTTNDFNDAWFVGFTPKLVTGVWVGFDQPRTILPGGFAADVAVPVWANFMKVATAGDKPEWFSPPPGVTSAQVCRLSGQLATDGCHDVEVVDDQGRIERRSMVYLEYFVSGSEPRSSCDLHRPRRILEKVAGLFGGSSPKPAPARIEDTGLPPQAATLPQAAAQTTPQPAPAEPQKKKRGFWSRMFGVGKRDEPDKPVAPGAPTATDTVPSRD